MHSPSKLITYLIVVLAVASSLFQATIGFGEESYTGAVDIRILHGIILMIFFMLAVLLILNGVKSGTTFFTMSDVNLVFTAPLSQKKILVMGLIKRMGATVFFFVCFLAYSNMLVGWFKIKKSDSVLLILTLALYIFLVQAVTLIIYAFTNSRSNRITACKYIVYTFLFLSLGYITAILFIKGVSFDTLLSAVSSPVLELVPIAGWAKGFIMALIAQNTVKTAVFGAALAIVAVGCACIYAKGSFDYYEDVLSNTESVFEMRSQLKQGKSYGEIAYLNGKKVKVRKEGISRGSGASVLFFKHIREQSRRSRFVILHTYTAIISVTALLTVFIAKAANEGISKNLIMGITLAVCVYIQFFFSMSSDLGHELQKHYIFLFPASSFKKLIFASMTSILRPVIDGAVGFTVAGLAADADAAVIIICILSYVSFGAVYNAANLIIERFFGKSGNRSVIISFYMLLLMGVLAPGVIISAVLALSANVPTVLLALPMILWNFGVSLICYILCRSALNNTEAA